MDSIQKHEEHQSHPAVLSGPNCLAGEAEIQGFLLEAEETE